MATARKKNVLPIIRKDENVFDIQQGVAIGIFIKRHKKTDVSHIATVHHADLWGLREIYENTPQGQQLVGGKYHWLAEHDITTTEWETIHPHAPFYLFEPQNTINAEEYERGWKITDILFVNVPGLVTARDSLTIHWSKEEAWKTVTDFVSLSPEEARTKYNLGEDTRDWKVHLAQKDVRTSGLSQDKLEPIFYRPFDIRTTYYTGNTRGFLSMPRNEVMHHMLSGQDLGLITVRQVAEGIFNHVMATNCIVDNRATLSNKGYALLLPLYLYPDNTKKTLFDSDLNANDSRDRRPNLAPTFIAEISSKLTMQFIEDGKGDLQQTFGAEDIFNYIYAVFHSPTYRSRYAEFLKIDFPRLPFTSNADLFRELCRLGERLVSLHLMEKNGQVTSTFPISGNNLVEKVDYTHSSDKPADGRIWINKTQYFDTIPPEVWEFHIGGYQVCHKWLKDRKGRTLSFDEIRHYQKIVATLSETIQLMSEIDETIEMGGGWPIE